MSTLPTTEAGTIAALAQQADATQRPMLVEDSRLKAPIVINPRTGEIQSIAAHLKPERKQALVVVHDHPSFIAYVKAHFEKGRTAVFATLTETGGQFRAILDYHNEGDTTLPAHGEHTCTLDLQHTPEWRRWTQANGKPMGQLEMAHFLEDNRLDIAEPDAATIVEIAKTFEASQGVPWKANAPRILAYRDRLWDLTHAAARAKARIDELAEKPAKDPATPKEEAKP